MESFEGTKRGPLELELTHPWRCERPWWIAGYVGSHDPTSDGQARLDNFGECAKAKMTQLWTRRASQSPPECAKRTFILGKGE